VSVALVIHYAKRMCRFIFSSMVCLGSPNFSTLSRKHTIFRKMVIESKTCVLSFFAYYVSNTHSQKNSATHHRRTQVFNNSTHYSCQILLKLEFSRDFRKPVKFEIS